ncbi:hypothetical protein [Staphylothermus hellenicus]|uniref:Uncharacterized protein n=1 Tax=Staphylothermus hellenicus (strain DSM 12710 / JCM 10830 / BK20S6-10-b1 / P8) TaxID=591019 RepID=D7D8T6_STAHD|nr:hypothetical protein [Staphylothermus hellenicus]ADI32182.1 hypothetical protein Shell_1078 [Staphylothermus hellenicus DSM 12710]
MKKRISYSEYIMEKVSRIIDELEIRNIKSAVLNDLAISLYGLIKPIDEIRILVENKELDSVAYVIARELGMSIYQKDIYNSLKTLGKAVVNPVFLPLTILEIAQTPLDIELLANRIKFAYEKIQINVPRLEHLVCKLLSYNAYPYNIYAFTLIITHKEIIDLDIVKKLLKNIGIEPDNIMKYILKIKSLIELFPELNDKHV